MVIMTIGLDLAKSVFQTHGVDENGTTVLVKKLHRKQMLAILFETVAMSDWRGGLRHGTLLGAYARRDGA